MALVSAKELAVKAECSPATIMSYARQGLIPYAGKGKSGKVWQAMFDDGIADDVHIMIENAQDRKGHTSTGAWDKPLCDSTKCAECFARHYLSTEPSIRSAFPQHDEDEYIPQLRSGVSIAVGGRVKDRGASGMAFLTNGGAK